jgi:hypothetical protein
LAASKIPELANILWEETGGRSLPDFRARCSGVKDKDASVATLDAACVPDFGTRWKLVDSFMSQSFIGQEAGRARNPAANKIFFAFVRYRILVI